MSLVRETRTRYNFNALFITHHPRFTPRCARDTRRRTEADRESTHEIHPEQPSENKNIMLD